MDNFAADEAASMHSLEDEWIVTVHAGKVDADSWKIGIQPYPTAADAQRAAEHYVDFYKLCPSQRATSMEPPRRGRPVALRSATQKSP